MKHIYSVRCTTSRHCGVVASFNTREEASKCIDYLIEMYPGHRFRVSGELVFDEFDILDSVLIAEITTAMDYYDSL